MQHLFYHKNNEYKLTADPISAYFKSITLNQFDPSQFASIECFWKISDDKLILYKLVNSENIDLSFFNFEMPIIADWYTGSLEFAIKEYFDYENDHKSIYYVYLVFKNGFLIEKKVILKLLNFQKLKIKFGKYRGSYIEDIVKGKFQSDQNIRNYINELLNFLFKKFYSFKLHSPKFHISNEEKEIVYKAREISLNFSITDNVITLCSDNKEAYHNINQLANNVFDIIDKILSSDFKYLSFVYRTGGENNAFNGNSILLNHDINYIKWAIENVPTFCVPPHLLERPFYFFRFFFIERIDEYSIKFKPYFEIVDPKITYEFIHFNNNKFETLYNVSLNWQRFHYEILAEGITNKEDLNSYLS